MKLTDVVNFRNQQFVLILVIITFVKQILLELQI